MPRYSGNRVCEGSVIKEVTGKDGVFDRGWDFWIQTRLNNLAIEDGNSRSLSLHHTGIF